MFIRSSSCSDLSLLLSLESSCSSNIGVWTYLKFEVMDLCVIVMYNSFSNWHASQHNSALDRRERQRKRDRKGVRETSRESHTHREREKETETEKEWERQTERDTEREIYIERNRCSHSLSHNSRSHISISSLEIFARPIYYCTCWRELTCYNECISVWLSWE